MTRLMLAILAVLVLAGPARAQEPDAPLSPTIPTRDAEELQAARQRGGAMPDVAEILGAIDKATQPPRDAAEEEGWSAPVRLAIVFAFLALLPALLVMMTSFTRIVIVLSFVRRALSTQTIPPTIAIIGLSLFLTFFTMAPVFGEINEVALGPYLDDAMTFPAAVQKGSDVLRDFMIRQTRTGDLQLFLDMGNVPAPKSLDELPLHVVIPAYAISEFRTAFEIGCLLFVPFLLIDLVTGAILLSAGMMMLPPVIVSLPFKIILFVLVDGWRLLIETLVLSFR